MSLRSVTIVEPGRMGFMLGVALAQSREVVSLDVFGCGPDLRAHPLDPRIVEEIKEMFDRYVGLETTRIGIRE